MDPNRLGLYLRALRRRKHWRQADLSAATGVSRSSISRLESGGCRRMSVGDVERLIEAVGGQLDLTVRWHGEGLARLVDAAHADLVERIVGVMRRLGWIVEVEATFNVRGERGAIDVLAFAPVQRALLVVEVKSVVPDLQAMLSSLDRKARLGPIVAGRFGWRTAVVGRLLLLPESRTIRRRLADHRTMLDAAFPTRGRQVTSWLRRPTGPLAGILLLPSDSRGPGLRRPGSGQGGRIRVGPRSRSIRVAPPGSPNPG